MRNKLKILLASISFFLVINSNLFASDTQYFYVIKKRFAVNPQGKALAFHYMPDKFVAKKLKNSILLKWTFFEEKQTEMDNYYSFTIKNLEEFRFFKYDKLQNITYNLTINTLLESKKYKARLTIIPRYYRVENGFFDCDKIDFLK